MKIYLIKKLNNTFGQPDYKGINIATVVPGSPVYPKDPIECILAVNDDTAIVHDEVIELTEEEYTELKLTYLATYDEPQQEVRIVELEAQNAQILLALVMGGLM